MTSGADAALGIQCVEGLIMFLSARAFANRPWLALLVTVAVLTACAPEPSGSATSERSGTAERWKLPPDYNRGPQIRNNP